MVEFGMRQRFRTVLWVGASAFALVAVLFFVTAKEPPVNSIEWHKHHYRKLFNKRAGKIIPTICSRAWRRLTGAPLISQSDISNSMALSAELDRHRDALVHLRFLTERTIPLTNAPAEAVIVRAYQRAQTNIPKARLHFTHLSAYHPSGIVVIVTGCAEDMAVLEKMVIECDKR